MSQVQKDFALVEEIAKPKRQGQPHDSDGHLSQAAANVMVQITSDIAAGKTRSQLQPTTSTHQIAGEINRDRIHAHPDERFAPTTPFEDVNDPIEYSEQNRAVTAGDQNVGRGPNLFNDWKLQIPTPAQGSRCDPGRKQEDHLALSFYRLVLQQESGENAEQARADRWNRAEIAFGIEVVVVLFAREVFEVEGIAAVV